MRGSKVQILLEAPFLYHPARSHASHHSGNGDHKMDASEFTQLLLSLACILAMARALGLLAERWKQPAVMGELAAGLVIGPTLLGRFMPNSAIFSSVSNTSHLPLYLLLVKISSVIVMFVSGFDVDLSRLWKERKPITLVSIMGFVFPFICGTLAYLAFPILDLPVGDKVFGMLFWGTAMTMTSLPVIARIFFDLRIMQTAVANITMISAAFNGIWGFLVFSAILTKIPGLENSTNSNNSVFLIFFSFLAGTLVTRISIFTPKIKQILVVLTAGIFAPILFSNAALSVDLFTDFSIPLVLLICIVAALGKIIGCAAAAKFAGLHSRESWAMGFAMNARGATGIIFAILAHEYRVVTEEIFVALTAMALITSLTAAPFLARLLNPSSKLSAADISAS